jgi:ferredoxin
VRIRIDENRCQGHTLCQIAASQVIKLRDDDGHAYVDDDLVPAGFEEAVRMAAATCPEDAISIGE